MASLICNLDNQLFRTIGRKLIQAVSLTWQKCVQRCSNQKQQKSSVVQQKLNGVFNSKTEKEQQNICEEYSNSFLRSIGISDGDDKGNKYAVNGDGELVGLNFSLKFKK